ncbi:Coenzyme F420 hydrogenase/dehydrogenase, beta subunit C-terminal domain [Segatella baroniae]|uniref:Coenzyme F420 hydrogenase/dehydrogenase, beta subunit C-terminal domain n=1 Tax=Segatella baroniae TaxID=305719 RepID=UPI00041B35D9|nr:Coenzyme F420 hydrogenase/dehydrogenase, beta subunit C-terminal domain [Segatella baroniae]
MIDFNFNNDCCGCAACYNSCPVNAIRMVSNSEGFLIPSVDRNLCIDCGKCERVCAHLNTTTERFSIESFKSIKSYLYFSQEKNRKESASGGLVYDAMKQCLEHKGIVCGCAWNDKIEAKHIVIDKKEDLYRLQSSKYVQSEIGKSFSQIKAALKEGRKVVFCGTPCQTAGLKTFLGKQDTSNLTSICVICHGTPSPLVWKQWKECQEEKYQGKLSYINMRDKHTKGYSTTCCKYIYKQNNKEKVVIRPAYIADPYVYLFSDSLYLRNSCYHCQYKANMTGADIVTGDFHPSIKEAGKWGCSTVFAMTEKGRMVIQSLSGFCKEGNYQDLASINPMLWKSAKSHPKRQEFFKIIEKGATESDFKEFLPKKYYIKVILSKLGIFNIIRKML